MWRYIRKTYFGVEFDDIVDRHLWRPSRWREDKNMGGARVFRVDTQLHGFPCRLCTGPSDNHNILETVRVECFACQLDGLLALSLRKELGFPVAPLDKDSSNAALPHLRLTSN